MAEDLSSQSASDIESKAYRLTGTTLLLRKKFFRTKKYGEKRNPTRLAYTKSSCASTVHG